MSLPGSLYINSACRIKQGQVWKGDQSIFRQEAESAAGFLQGLYKFSGLNYPKWYKMDRLSQLGILATEILLQGTGASLGDKPTETAIILANRHSSLDTDARFTAQLDEIPSPAVFVYTLPNIVIGEISIRHGLKGEQAFFLMTEPDLPFLVQYAQTLFAEGQTKHLVMGWLDLFRDQYEATVFLVSENCLQATDKLFNAENLFQYIYHEQGAVN